MYMCGFSLCPFSPLMFAVLFLPSWWTRIFVLPAVMFSLSSGYSAALPTRSPVRALSGVCLTLSHQYRFNPAPPLAAVSPPLSTGHLSSGSSLFVSQWRARGLCCVRERSALSTGPWASISRVHPQCPSRSRWLFLCFQILLHVVAHLFPPPMLSLHLRTSFLPFPHLLSQTFSCFKGPWNDAWC